MSLPSDLPANLSYTSDHEWIATDGDVSTVGVTAHAADALGDVVFLSLPAVGSTVVGGEPCGEIESTKSVSDLFAPADGEVVEVNEDAVADPAVLNHDPFGAGWLFRMRITGAGELLDAAAYAALIEGV
jgi:glycine cleavage system H protein